MIFPTSVSGWSYSHDGRGNLTSDGLARTFCYDLENRLVGVAPIAANPCSSPSTLFLSYDPLGRLQRTISGGVTRDFLYDGDALVAEYEGAALVRRYVHGAGVDEPLVWYQGAGLTDRRWLIADWQGTIIAHADAAGATQRYTYGPYGEPDAWGSQSTHARFRYTGQAALPEVGLYHYKARVYDPVLGRFLQTDPVGYEDDLNLYAYVRNDPINGVDPTGTECVNGSDGNTRCVTEQYDVSFSTPQGFQNTNPQADDYHTYDTPAASPLGESATRDWVRENPTPAAVQGAATPEGTLNDATPVVGGLLPVRISPVESFTTTNQVTGNQVVVNATLPGHPLGNGIVVRDTMPGPNGTSVIQNWGEGNGALQAPGSAVAGPINGVWAGHTPPAPTPPGGYDLCSVRPGAC